MGETKSITGMGYHDHQWGSINFHKYWNHRIWARQSYDDCSLLLFDFFTNEEYGTKRFPIIFIQDNNGNFIFESHNNVECKVEKQYTGNSLGEEIVALCSEDTREDIKTLLCSEIREVIELMHPTTIKYSPVIQQIISYVNENYYEEVSLKTLAQKYHINTSYLGQVFTKEVGCSFSEYLNKTKNMKAKELILNTNMKINDIAKKVGYLDTSYFYRKFKKYYGVCPSTLRNIKNY